MSGHDASRPVVDYVATTRRRWSKPQKRSILAEVDAPGGSVSDVARRHGLHTSLLFRWRRDLGTKPMPRSSSSPPPAFVPLTLPAPMPAAPSAPPSPARADVIEIVLTSGRIVRVGGGVDVTALRRLLDALEE